jgi:spermidine synthase
MDFRAGVVGLGAGVMACNAKEGERWRFFEIDPVVLKIASNPKRFTFLSSCQPNADVVLGDARLTVAKEEAGSFDFLLIDAFASDAIPVHLLTKEAVALYLDKLSPKGILALHVSNRHMDLQTIASATAKALPDTFVGLAHDRVKSKGLDAASSHVVFVTRSPEAFKEVLSLPYVTPVDIVSVTPWTDDFSNIISSLWRKARS